MNDRFLMNVIHLERMSSGTVEQNRICQRCLGTGSPQRSNPFTALFLQDVADHHGPRNVVPRRQTPSPSRKLSLMCSNTSRGTSRFGVSAANRASVRVAFCRSGGCELL